MLGDRLPLESLTAEAVATWNRHRSAVRSLWLLLHESGAGVRVLLLNVEDLDLDGREAKAVLRARRIPVQAGDEAAGPERRRVHVAQAQASRLNSSIWFQAASGASSGAKCPAPGTIPVVRFAIPAARNPAA